MREMQGLSERVGQQRTMTSLVALCCMKDAESRKQAVSEMSAGEQERRARELNAKGENRGSTWCRSIVRETHGQYPTVLCFPMTPVPSADSISSDHSLA